MERAKPYRRDAPPIVSERISKTLSMTMYLVQTIGPTCYVIQEQESRQKYKVSIGLNQLCSCGKKDICVHILFVMMKVLKIPKENPLVFQKSLLDSEVSRILRGDFQTNRTAHRTSSSSTRLSEELRAKHNAAQERESESTEKLAARQAIVVDEVCAVCQEDMNCEKPLIYCKRGCGNNFHIECST